MKSFDVTVKGLVETYDAMTPKDLANVVSNLLTDFLRSPDVPPSATVLITSVEVTDRAQTDDA